MFSSKLLLGINKFTSTLDDLEYETSVSIWNIEIMLIQKR